MNCGCGAYLNPAWERCHVCGRPLKDPAVREARKTDTINPTADTGHSAEGDPCRLIRRVYSRLLGEVIYFVQDKTSVNGVELRPPGAVYTRKELAALLAVSPSPAELRAIHRVKTAFEGELSR